MQGVIEQRRHVEALRQADFEAYQQWEYQRRYYEEITDISERVRAPISPTQEFALTVEGLVSARGELLGPIIEGGVNEARRMAAIKPDWHVEFERRTIELEEYNDLEALAVQGTGALVSYWLIPDAVRAGADLPGYNRDRLKMFTRVAVPTADGIAIKYHSYDGSYLPGVQAMDEALGFVFDSDRGSEQIARERRYIPVRVDSVDVIDEILQKAYDGALARDFGGGWDGGRVPLAVKDVLGFIYGQHELLDEHMRELTRVFALTRDPYERNRLMKQHRYDLAAAIDDLLHGKQVTTVAEAGEGARNEGRNLDGDCPTGDAPSTQDQLDSVGFKSKMNRVRIIVVADCRTCLIKKPVVINECHMCLDCERVDNIEGSSGLNRIIREAQNRRSKKDRLAAKAIKLVGIGAKA